MNIEIIEEEASSLAEYARVPIAFRVTQIMNVGTHQDEFGTFILSEHPADNPYMKDYDAINGEGPMQWAARFDISNWGLFAAKRCGRRVGGAAIAFRTPCLSMLEDREDLAVLWDIRVAPESRGQGVGSALFAAAEAWAAPRGCRQLKVETQNINVPACRLYARQGCVLRAVDRFAYPQLPKEVQLLWYKDLSQYRGAG